MRRVALLFALAVLSSCGLPPPSPRPTAAELLKERPYDLRLPTGTSGHRPLLLALHGQCGTTADLDEGFQLTAAAQAAGALLVFPAAEVAGNLCAFWNASGNNRWPYDEDYLAAVLADIKSKQDVDPKRVFVFGHSLGAFMALRLACVHAELVTGVVSSAGLVSLAPGFCAPSQPLSVLTVHGDADPVISYDGGPFLGDPPRQTSPSAHDTINLFATRNGCSGPVASTGEKLDLDATLPGPETVVESAPGCPAGGAATLWTIHGAGHFPDVTGDFAVRVLAFLSAHPRP